jgi:hypothetical protein
MKHRKTHAGDPATSGSGAMSPSDAKRHTGEKKFQCGQVSISLISISAEKFSYSGILHSIKHKISTKMYYVKLVMITMPGFNGSKMQ